jgi:hypothetical protein
MACEHLSKVGVHDLYLDCVDVAGFLPAFYARLGFTKIAERSTTYPTGNRFSMVLMRRESNDA